MKRTFISASVGMMLAGMLVMGCTKNEEMPEKAPIIKESTTEAKARTVTATIVVKAGTTYDGRGERITAVGLGDGGQGEGQKPIFKLEKGAKLSNVIITAPGADGVHCYGDNYIYNVVWEDVGEDALTVKGSGWVTVDRGAAYNAADKIFQINQPSTFTVKNFYADTFGKVIRQLGGSTFTCTMWLDNNTFKNGKECIARTDSKTTKAYYRALNVSNVPRWWIFPSASQVSPY